MKVFMVEAACDLLELSCGRSVAGCGGGGGGGDWARAGTRGHVRVLGQWEPGRQGGLVSEGGLEGGGVWDRGAKDTPRAWMRTGVQSSV